MAKILIVDGNSIVNRAFFGVRPLSTKDGLPTNAVYGFLTILQRHLEQLKPEYAAIAYDLKAPTFRHRLSEAYKANRHGMPDDLAVQMPYAKRCAEALGFRAFTLEGFEADDILGTLAAEANREGIDAYLLTGDRDSLQLISEHTGVLLATNTETVLMNRDAFFEKYGVEPQQFVDVKALMGDSSDNIPGVPGIGEKTALKLIAHKGSLDGVYADISSLDVGPSAKAKLEAGKDSAYLSRTLAEICTTAPLNQSVDACTYRGTDADALYSLCSELEFSGIIKRLGLTAPNKAAKAMPTAQVAENLVVSQDEVVAVLPCEDGYWLGNGTVVGFCSDLPENGRFAVSDAKAFYRLTGQRERVAFDFSLAGYLLSPTSSDYALDRLCTTYLGFEPIPGDGKEAQVSQVDTMARLYPVLKALLEEQNMLALLEKIELPLAFVLADMENQGFLIHPTALADFGKKLDESAEAAAAQIYFMAGREFNINSPKQLGEVLFETLQLPTAKKTKTGYSTNAEVLEKLRPYHPIIDEIFRYRQVIKLKSTYVEGLLRVADATGRVHTSFNQTVTATGRLSSTEPNLQNIPVRTELGRELRRFFRAKEGYVLADADYSQIELRLLAHIADDETMIRAFRNGDDIHTITASQVFGVPTESVTPAMRKSAKAVNFGIVYGISDFSLGQDIGVSKAEAGRYIKSYLSRYPQVSAYMKDIVEAARKDGYVTTLFGRRREIPELRSTKKPMIAFGERIAMNSPIQGSAADLIKLAMLRVDEALRRSGLDAHLILQVHDELIVEVRQDQAEEAAKILQAEMENASSFSVPMVAEVKIGKTWFECK